MKHIQPFSIISSLAAAALLVSEAPGQSTTRVSVDSAGGQGNQTSGNLVSSADGRYLAFLSNATNFVPADTNGEEDIFFHDRQTGRTTRVSVNSAGGQANDTSYDPQISADGRYVVFESRATNLVPGDTNGSPDVFLHDPQLGVTVRINLNSAGVQANRGGTHPSISSDGQFIAFESESTNLLPGGSSAGHIYVRDLQSGQTSLVSLNSSGVPASRACWNPFISADGRFVAFSSRAGNLVPGGTNHMEHIYIHDRQTGQTSRASVSSAGGEGDADSAQQCISADGRYVAYYSWATNLVLGDTNGVQDVFLHDRQTGQTSRISVDAAGTQGNALSSMPSISTDGRFLSFTSKAANLVPGDTNGVEDVFVFELPTGQLSRISVDSAGVQGNLESSRPTISSDGRFVSFDGYATNLVPGDTNGVGDAFLHDRAALPSLVKAGSCPGAMTLTINNATANGQVAILSGPAGIFVKPTPPCQGLVLGISPPTLRTMLPANGSGTVILNFNAPAGLCGSSVQAVDVTTCVATNVIVL